MKKFIFAISIIFLFLNFSIIYADEVKTDEGGESEKQVTEAEIKVNEIFVDLKNKKRSEINAIRYLEEIGEPAVPYITKELFKDDKTVVVVAAHALYNISGDECASDLVKAYVHHVGKIHMVQIGLVIDFIGDEALPFLYKELGNEKEQVRFWIVDKIAKIDVSKSLKKLKKQYKRETSDLVKLQIIRSTYEIEERKQKEYLAFIHKSLKSDDEFTKCTAIMVVGEIKDESQASFLIECIGDKLESIRTSAITALTNFEREDAVSALIGALDHKDVTTRCYAIAEIALHEYENKVFANEIIKALIGKLSDENSQVRCQVIFALSSYDELSIIPHLVKVVKDDDDEIMRNRAEAAIKTIIKNKETRDREKEQEKEDQNEKSDKFIE